MFAILPLILTTPIPYVNTSNSVISYVRAAPHSYYTLGDEQFLHLDEPGFSYVQVDTGVIKEPNKAYVLHLRHLASLEACVPVCSITIEVNGTVILTGYQPVYDSFSDDEIDITQWVENGGNTIRIYLDKDSRGAYWLQQVQIETLTEESLPQS